MKTIRENYENEIIIKNSRFICYLIRLDSSDINGILTNIKNLHPKATHYCYGYIFDDDKKSSDDGEPGGTAGLPILNVLEKEGINHILAIVVRYFGGIKLGAGGLVRAYTKSITETLKISEYIELIKGFKISLTFNYQDEKTVNYILNDMSIVNKRYDQDIYYEAFVDQNTLDKLKQFNPVIIMNTYIEK